MYFNTCSSYHKQYINEYDLNTTVNVWVLRLFSSFNKLHRVSEKIKSVCWLRPEVIKLATTFALFGVKEDKAVKQLCAVARDHTHKLNNENIAVEQFVGRMQQSFSKRNQFYGTLNLYCRFVLVVSRCV